MQAIAASFERAAVPLRGLSTRRRPGILRRLSHVFGRLVPSRDGNGDAELPDAWFKYPPI